MGDDQDLEQLDALVAVDVMGWKEGYSAFRPSSDIVAAWQVIEKLQRDGHSITLVVDGRCNTQQLTIAICVSAIRAVGNKGKNVIASSLGDYSAPLVTVAPPVKSATPKGHL